MPIYEAVPDLHDGIRVEESETERWESKMTLGFKPNRPGYIGRGEVMEGKIMISMIVLLIWEPKRYLGGHDQHVKTQE